MRDMTGSPPVALGEGMAGDFSPDGKWAAATVSYTQLILLPTGAGTVRRIDRGDIQQYGYHIHWLPDGKQILFPGNQRRTRGPVFCSEHRWRQAACRHAGRSRLLPDFSRWKTHRSERCKDWADRNSIRWTAERRARHPRIADRRNCCMDL